MTYPQGINFRATAGFVTDGAAEQAETTTASTGDYPHTTAQGNTVGWESFNSGNTRDRSAAVDRRLAGVNFTTSTQNDFRFDLPAAGSYNIRAAFGDMSSVNPTLWTLLDGTSTITTLATGNNSAAGSFKDATDTVRTAAAWPGSNVARAATFSTTICRFRSSAAGSANLIAHAYVESAAPAGASGTLAATLAGASLSASGTVIASGALQSTLTGASLAASGLVASPPSGALASTLAGAAMSANGGVTNVGALAASLDGATMSAVGTVTNRAALASQLDGAGMAASGSVITIPAGALSSTLDGAGLTAGGYVGTPPAAPDFFLRLPKNPRHVIHHH